MPQPSNDPPHVTITRESLGLPATPGKGSPTLSKTNRTPEPKGKAPKCSIKKGEVRSPHVYKKSFHQWREEIHKAFQEVCVPERSREIAMVLYNLAVDGNMEAIKEWNNRTLGKAIQQVDVTHTQIASKQQSIDIFLEVAGASAKHVSSRELGPTSGPADAGADRGGVHRGSGIDAPALPAPVDLRPVEVPVVRQSGAGGADVLP